MNETTTNYLTCEHRSIYVMLMTSAGMMGAYTFNLRGGVFCNAQTGNIVMLSIAFGKGNFREAAYFLIPIAAYLLGAVISELLLESTRKIGVLQWATWLIAIESVMLFAIGFIPLSWSDHIVQLLINFIASMQYNTFRKAEGIPMATTFCTNHVRQVGVALAKNIGRRDVPALKRGGAHFAMVFCFFLGGAILTFACDSLQEKAIWLCLAPLLIALVLLLRADLAGESQL